MNNNNFKSKIMKSCSVLIPILLSSCAPFMSSSLRVEVDVYQGPVSLEKVVQEAELDALINSLPSGLKSLDDELEISMCRLGCISNTKEHNFLVDKKTCSEKLRTYPNEESSVTIVKKKKKKNGKGYFIKLGETTNEWHNICPPMIDLRENVHSLRIIAKGTKDKVRTTANQIQPESHKLTEGKTDKQIKQIEAKITQIKTDLYRQAIITAGFLRITAIEVAFSIASVQNPNKRVRISQAKLANFSAEYSNQLSSRADTLLKIERGIKPELLPTSIYLRDAAPTAFLDLFEQYDASADGENFNNARERANITRKLFDDDNWGRVNEVYASGMGKVSMAYIKDDIGNWNLKSFENDPTEMIEAYKQVGIAGLKAAKDAISGTGGVGEAIDLLSGANQAQTGNVNSGGTSPLDLGPLREKLVSDIEEKKKKYDKENISIDDRKQAIGEMKDLLDHYDYLINALQTVTVSSIEKEADKK